MTYFHYNRLNKEFFCMLTSIKEKLFEAFDVDSMTFRQHRNYNNTVHKKVLVIV